MLKDNQLYSNKIPPCLNAALEYVEHGWRVVSVEPAGKRPLIKDWTNQATTYPDIVRGWWDTSPDANVAIVTGSASGLVVIDVDVNSEKDIDGESSLRELEAENGSLPVTVEAKTGGGGRHLFFALPAGREIGNSVGRLGKGLDVRGEGGCVVAPPSAHKSGHSYEWRDGHSPEDLKPADPPAWLIDLLVAGEPRAEPSGTNSDQIPSGQRNDALFRLACSLFRQGLSEPAVGDAIHRENAEQCDPPLPDEELDQLLQSAGRYPSGDDAAGDTRPTIRAKAGELPRMVDEAEQALIADAGVEIYEHAGRLVSPIAQRRREALDGVERERGAVVLRPMTPPRLVEALTKAAQWTKWDGRSGNDKVIDCPARIATTLLSRNGYWHFPLLEGIVECPTLREDGSLLDSPGYDAQSGLLLDFDSQGFPPIPERPTREDAREALEKLKGPLSGFPFVSEADRSVALAAIVTAPVRRCLRSAPLFGNTAPTMGSGKTLLANSVSLIASGRDAAVMSQAKSGEEDQKRLLSILLANDLIVVIDNVERPLGGDTLCAILTQPTYRDRLLGENTTVTVSTNAMFMATGNNLSVQGDMTRRTLLCTIDPGCERPDERQFKVDLRKHILAHRGELVAAILTVLRAYVVAGKPKQKIQPYGSFEEWSDLVRSALVWLGEADPLDTRKKIEDADPERQSLEAVLAAWSAIYKDEPVTMAQVIDDISVAIDAESAGSVLQAALVEAVGDQRGTLNTKKIGKWAQRAAGRIAGGLKLEQDKKTSSGTWRWRVVQAGQPADSRVTGFAGCDSGRKQKNAPGEHADGQPAATAGAILSGQPKPNPANPETQRRRRDEIRERMMRRFEPGTPENFAYHEAVRRGARKFRALQPQSQQPQPKGPTPTP